MTSVCPAGVTFLLLLLILLDRLLLVILELVRCVSCQFPCHNDLPGCRLGTAAGYYGLGGHQGGAHCLIFSTFCKMMSESPQRIKTLPEVIIRSGGSCCRPERGWEMPTMLQVPQDEFDQERSYTGAGAPHPEHDITVLTISSYHFSPF